MRFNSEVYNKVYHPEPEEGVAQVRAHLTKPEKEKEPEKEPETELDEEPETELDEEPETETDEEPEGGE